jgi:hypothetical protein
MALVNSLLTAFSKAIAVAETLYTVEKTKVAAVQAEANDIFLVREMLPVHTNYYRSYCLFHSQHMKNFNFWIRI